MATNYPGSLDVFTNPASGNTLDSPSHSLQHSNLNDAVEAVETKLGIGTATPGTATAYYPLVSGTAGATSWTPLTYQGITAGSATSGQVLTSQGGGTAIWSTPTVAGLVLLNTTSFSGVTTQAISSVFSSTYRHYQIIGSITSAAATTSVKLRLRSGSTDNSATNYASGAFFTGGDGTSGNTDSSNGDTAFPILPLEASPSFPGGVFNYTLFNPFETQYTRLTGFYERTGGAGAFGYFRGGNLEVTTSYDGINIITDSAQNIAGVVSIYGFNQ